MIASGSEITAPYGVWENSSWPYSGQLPKIMSGPASTVSPLRTASRHGPWPVVNCSRSAQLAASSLAPSGTRKSS